MSAADGGDPRGSILLEEGEVLTQQVYAAGQHVLRVRSPRIAARAEPGSFAHLRCDDRLAMRRPLSIMRVDAEAGWVEFLYKVVGEGTRLLATRRSGESLSVLGPIGCGFKVLPERPQALLIGGGVGIPPMVFLSERLLDQPALRPLVLMGSEVPFPFATRPSTILIDGMPAGVIAALALLDDWGIPSRLASGQGYPGCHEGFVTDLARIWLQAMDPAVRHEQVAVYACGPTPMLRAVAALAEEFRLPCQVSLEEYMACAVGGCAGCTVRVCTPDGEAMKRVCVDGPVFSASEVLWEAIGH